MPDNKHQDALRTIGEVADDIGVATHVLRFWESKFIQIKPQKRRGRRYYRVEDVVTIKTIKELLYDHGYTIKGVHKFLKGTKTSSNSNVQPEPVLSGPDNFNRDLFGNIIADNNSIAAVPEFGTAEITKLKQIYKGLCVSRNKLYDLA